MRLATTLIEAMIIDEAEYSGASECRQQSYETCLEPRAGVCRHEEYGFTMIELVTIMVIAGVVAAMAAPRFFNNSAFQSRGFYDQVIFSLRYAQKTAIAQHRFVCVAFTASSVTLTVNATAACPGASLASPSGDTTYGIAAPNSNVVLSGYTSFYFDALGKPYNNADIPPASTFVKQTIAVSGYSTSPVYIEAETGYVH